jgi:CelD/BcsL family acetyltransferase involved in cellulose biosynthesis
MLQVHALTTAPEIESIRPVWQMLHGQTRSASFFQTFDWFEIYCREYRQSAPLVLLVESAGTPIGLVPLVLEQERGRLGSFRTLTYPVRNWGTHFGPVGPEPERSLKAALAHLARLDRQWDLIDLRWVPPPDRDPAQTHQVFPPACRGGRPYQSVALVDAACLAHGDSPRPTARHRKEIARLERRLGESGPVEFIRHRPAACSAEQALSFDPLFGACLEVARASWQSEVRDGNTLSHDEVRPFLRQVHRRAVQAGMADVCLLSVGGRSVAFAYNLHCGGRVFGLRMGYDRGFQPGGAGSVLAARMLEDGFRRGDQEFNLGEGSLDWKLRLGARVETTRRFTWYAATSLKAQTLRLARWLRSNRRSA